LDTTIDYRKIRLQQYLSHCHQNHPILRKLWFHPAASFQVALDLQNPAAEDLIDEIHRVQKTCQENMEEAQSYQHVAKRFRQDTPTFHVGDKVWLIAKNIRTVRPSKKLDHKRLGPSQIVEQIGTHAYRLELPPTMRVHPVFHVHLLDHTTTP